MSLPDDHPTIHINLTTSNGLINLHHPDDAVTRKDSRPREKHVHLVISDGEGADSNGEARDRDAKAKVRDKAAKDREEEKESDEKEKGSGSDPKKEKDKEKKPRRIRSHSRHSSKVDSPKVEQIAEDVEYSPPVPAREQGEVRVAQVNSSPTILHLNIPHHNTSPLKEMDLSDLKRSKFSKSIKNIASPRRSTTTGGTVEKKVKKGRELEELKIKTTFERDSDEDEYKDSPQKLPSPKKGRTKAFARISTKPLRNFLSHEDTEHKTPPTEDEAERCLSARNDSPSNKIPERSLSNYDVTRTGQLNMLTKKLKPSKFPDTLLLKSPLDSPSRRFSDIRRITSNRGHKTKTQEPDFPVTVTKESVEKPLVPRRRTGIPPLVPAKESQLSLIKVPDLRDYTLDKLEDIYASLLDNITGLKRTNYHFYLKTYENVFSGKDLVSWISQHCNLERTASVDLAKRLYYRNFVRHVTDSASIVDSTEFYYTPDPPTEEWKAAVMKMKKFIYQNDDNERVPRKTLDQFVSPWGTYTDSVKPLPDYRETYKNFWNPFDNNNSSSESSALPSFVPRLVLRHYNKEMKPIKLPYIEEFYGCVQFVDISGFTPLAEKLGEEGNKGTEKLTTYLNDYFGKLISLIQDHGGDIVKFAGDALLAVWPTENEEDLPSMILLACQCAVDMQELNDFSVKEGVLKVHSGIGVGKMWGMHVGGVNGSIEFLVAGDVLEQMASCEGAAAPGEVFISGECWKIVRDRLVVTVDEALTYNDPLLKSLKIGTAKQDGNGRTVLCCELNLMLQNISMAQAASPPNFRLEGIHARIEKPDKLPPFTVNPELLESYVPKAVTKRLSAEGKLSSTIGEFRSVSVIFVNLKLPFTAKSSLDLVQSCMIQMQQAVYEYEGTVRQFLFDDKGSVLIACFGVPPFAHEDNQYRAVKTGLKIHKELLQLNVKNSIGITTGKVFCGTVGTANRREYAVVGDVVNLSARLMAAAKGRVWCDQETYKLCCDQTSSQAPFNTNLPEITVKGKSFPIQVYEPLDDDEEGKILNPSSIVQNIGMIGRDEELNSMLQAYGSRCETRFRKGKSRNSKKTDSLMIPHSETDKSILNQSIVIDIRDSTPKRLKSKRTNQHTRTCSNEAEYDPNAPLRRAVSNLEPQTTTTPTKKLRRKTRKREDEVEGMNESPPRLKLESLEEFPVKPKFGLPSSPSLSLNNVDLVASVDLVMTPERFDDKRIKRIASNSKAKRHSSNHNRRGRVEDLFDEKETEKEDHPVLVIREDVRKSAHKDINTIIISGQPGIGKTTLIKSFMHTLPKHRLLFATATKLGANTAYHAWREIFFSVLNLESTSNQGDLAKEVSSAVATTVDRKMVELLPLLNPILQLEIPETATTQELSPDLRIESTRELLIALLVSSPFRVIVIDNCSWLDSASWGLALSIAQDVKIKNILLVLSGRPITGEPAYSLLANSKKTLQIKLEPMDVNQSVNFMCQRLQVKSIPLEVEEVLKTKAQGIPMVLEELAVVLTEFVENGKCILTLEQEKTLQKVFSDAKPLIALVTTKLDRLEQMELEILQMASVIGVTFSLKLLRIVLGENIKKKELMSCLKHLTELNILIKERERYYTFSNNFTVEVVYDQLLFQQKVPIHKRIAEWYEVGQIEGNETVLAHHWKRAENIKKAIMYYDKGGQKAMENYANREAVQLFSEALELVRSNKTEFSVEDIKKMVLWQRQLGQSYYNLGKFERATTHLEDALVLLKQPLPSTAVSQWAYVKVKGKNALKDEDSIRDMVLIFNCLAKVNFYRCEKKIIAYCNKQALKFSLQSNLKKELCETYANCILGATLSKKNKKSAIEFMKLGKSMAEMTHAPLTQLQLNSGMYYSGVGNWNLAHESYASAIASAKVLKDFRRLEEAYIFDSVTFSIRGDSKKSSEGLKEAYDSSVRRGDIQMQILALIAKMYDDYIFGRREELLKKLELLKDSLGSIDKDSYILDMACKINYYSLKAICYVYKGILSKAFESAKTALNEISKTSPTMFINFVGYSIVPEVFLLILQWVQVTQNPNSTGNHALKTKDWNWEKSALSSPKLPATAKLVAKVTKSLACLQKFCDVFEFARSRYFLLNGVYETEKVEKTYTYYQESIEAARKLDMDYDLYLAYYVFGSKFLIEEGAKSKYLQDAKDGLVKMNVDYEQLLLKF